MAQKKVRAQDINASGTPSSSTFFRGDNTWSAVSGTGDVVGPSSATDNALARFDTTTGKLIQNSAATVDDSGILSTASIIVSGTNGAGHINLRHQASDAVATGQSTALFADANGDIKYKNDGDFYTTLKTSTNTADRTYTFLDNSYNVLGSTAALTTGSVLFAGSNGLITQDNASFFFDDTNNRLIIGANATDHPGASYPSSVNVVRTGIAYSVNAGYGASSGGNFTGFRANGTPGSPTAVASGNNLANFNGGGYTGSGWASAGGMRVLSSEAWTGSAIGSQIFFTTVPNGTTTGVDSMMLSQAGNLALGTSTAQTTRFSITNTRSAAYTANTNFVVFDNTYTDTTSSGTVSSIRGSTFGTPTFAASTTTTYTAAATLYIAAAPIAGTNVTITSAYALQVASGSSLFNGPITSTGTVFAYFWSTNNAQVQLSTAGTFFNQQVATIVDTRTSTGTTTHGAINGMGSGTISNATVAVTYTNASTLYIDKAPVAGTNVSITNAWALYVNTGKAFFGGATTIGNVTFSGSTISSTSGIEFSATNGISFIVTGAGENVVFDPTQNFIGYATNTQLGTGTAALGFTSAYLQVNTGDQYNMNISSLSVTASDPVNLNFFAKDGSFGLGAGKIKMGSLPLNGIVATRSGTGELSVVEEHSAAATNYGQKLSLVNSNLSMTTARLIGRTTASTGNVEEITVGTGLTLASGSLSASTIKAAYDYIVYQDGTNTIAIKTSDWTVLSTNTIANSATTLQAAIDACDATSGTGGSIFISTGSYPIATGLVIQGNQTTDSKTVKFVGDGIHTTKLVGGNNINVITVSNRAKVVVKDFAIEIQGTGIGIYATNSSIDQRAFWLSEFANLYIVNTTGTHTGWGMNLENPFRSTFKNIDMNQVGNGLRLVAISTAGYNPGDCTFDRMFIELGTNTSGYGLEINSNAASFSTVNQNVFTMVELIASGTNQTAIALTGSKGGNYNRFYGSNIEGFKTLIDIAAGEYNEFYCNYVITQDTTGTTYFKCSSTSYNNKFSATFMDTPAQSVTVVNDANTIAGRPNKVEEVVMQGSATTYTFTTTAATRLRYIYDNINGTNHYQDLTYSTVANLPAASTAKGTARYVTDSNSTTFNATVAGGGANNIRVTSDGTNWKIG